MRGALLLTLLVSLATGGLPAVEWPGIVQRAYLKASNTDGRDHFATAVAIDGERIIIGAPSEASRAQGVDADQADNNGANVGAAYIFVRTATGTWQQEAYLKASNAEDQDQFGSAVAISGDLVAIGAYGEDGASQGLNGSQASNSEGVSGAVYLFRRAGGAWLQEGYLKAPNTDVLDQFGFSLALSGNTLAVGSPGEAGVSSGVGGNPQASHVDYHYSGAVNVYVREGRAGWTHQAYIKASNNDDRDEFGHAVALDGDTLAVGARKQDGAARGVNASQTTEGAAESGAAYIFVRDGLGRWSQQAYLKASNTDAGDGFGSRVAVRGDLVVVAADDEQSAATGVDGDQDDNSLTTAGAAYVFKRGTGGTWSQEAYLKPPVSRPSAWFGSALAVGEDQVLVGAFGDRSTAVGVDGDPTLEGVARSGAVHLFRRSTSGQWSQAHYLKPSNPGTAANFGRAIALSGTTLVVGDDAEKSGATGIDGDHWDRTAALSGAAFVFDLEAPEPPVLFTSALFRTGEVDLSFTTGQGLGGWTFQGSQELHDFSMLLEPADPVREILPGRYEVTLKLPQPPSTRYFLRALR